MYIGAAALTIVDDKTGSLLVDWFWVYVYNLSLIILLLPVCNYIHTENCVIARIFLSLFIELLDTHPAMFIQFVIGPVLSNLTMWLYFSAILHVKVEENSTDDGGSLILVIFISFS